jgi:cytochrome P450
MGCCVVRANQASSGAQQMSLEEILCQISTFIAAGHETVGSALTWTLYALACAPAAQRRLRSALEALPPPPPPPPGSTCGSGKMDTFVDALMNDCPYLDWVVRESLRVHAPVTMTMRTVGRAEDVIPLTPGHEVVDRCGRVCGSVRVRKGDIITLPLQAVNRSTEVWGEDAAVFR